MPPAAPARGSRGGRGAPAPMACVLVTSVENLYLQEMQRKRASRSPTPLIEYGRPCVLSTTPPSSPASGIHICGRGEEQRARGVGG